MPRLAPVAIVLALLAVPLQVLAHQSAGPAATPAEHIDAAARPAVAVVDAFSAALKQLDVAKAGALLADDALVLESGGAERSRVAYLAAHAGQDAMFLQQATVRRLHRTARAEGNLAWVGTESDITSVGEDKPLALRSTETMVLRRTPAGWRIVHIHWSSRRPMESETAAVASGDAIQTRLQDYAGWYMEHGERRTFLACGKPQAWEVASSATLAERARAFGLTPDSPVYARVRGGVASGVLSVMSVIQFGSPTPIRDCPMNGVVLPAAN